MAHPSAWRQERRGSWSDDDGPVPGQKPDPGTRRPYSPVAETVSIKSFKVVLKKILMFFFYQLFLYFMFLTSKTFCLLLKM